MQLTSDLSREPFDCLVIGDALFDIIVGLPREGLSLCKAGTSYCRWINTCCGGSANVAVGVSLLGGTSGFVGGVGKDMFGELYIKDLESHNVRSMVFRDSAQPTGVCLSFVTCDGERTFLMSRGASDCLSVKRIDMAANLISEARVLYVSGYSLANQKMRNAIIHAVKVAARHETKIMFDPASHNLIRTNRDSFMEIIDYVDFLCLNLDEAHELTGIRDLPRMTDSLINISQGMHLVALKRGDKGCVVATRQQTIYVDAEETSCVDTTGAGDCFASAIAFGLTHNLSPLAMGILGNLLGGYKVQHLGARVFPSKREIRRFLNASRRKEAPAGALVKPRKRKRRQTQIRGDAFQDVLSN